MSITERDLLADVEAWCATVLPARRPLHLLNVRPTAAELAAHPGSLAIQAYFAGARHAAGERPQPFPRPLTDCEAESWMDGYSEHRAELPEARRGPDLTSSCDSLLGILVIDEEPWHSQPHGRAGGPISEAS